MLDRGVLVLSCQGRRKTQNYQKITVKDTWHLMEGAQSRLAATAGTE